MVNINKAYDDSLGLSQALEKAAKTAVPKDIEFEHFEADPKGWEEHLKSWNPVLLAQWKEWKAAQVTKSM